MVNENLRKLAFDNLIFLSKEENFINNKYKLNNLSFESSENETFDTIYSLKELEYPLYFTINQIINELYTSYDYLIYGYKRQDIIIMLDNIVEMLYQYYELSEENNAMFELFLDDIDDKVFYINGYYKYGICQWLPIKFNEYLNWFCIKSIKISKEIINDYLEDIYSPGRYDNSDDYSDNDDLDDSDESTDKNKSDNKSDNNSNDVKVYKPSLTRSKSEEELLLTGDPVISSSEDSDEQVNSKKLD